MQKLLAFIASGFGLGYSPFAPGTVGCLLGLPITWYLNTHYGIQGQLVAAALQILIAVPLSQAAENEFKAKDPKRCVADEYLTFSLCMVGLPVPGQPGGWIMMGIAFLTCRFFDIAKIWPAHGLQRLKGGVGIVIDDVFAMFYALAANHAAWYLLNRLGWLEKFQPL